MTRRSLRLSGVTLVELLITVAVTSVLMTLVMAIVIGQQRALQATESQRGSNESGRDALFEMKRTLRRAGFGVDPRYAFDFTWSRCKTTDQVTGVGTRAVCRDRIDGPDSLAFVARNTQYRVDPQGTNGCASALGCPYGNAWAVTATNLSGVPTITVQANAGTRFDYGRTLLLVCSGGQLYTMVTVAAGTTVTTTGGVTLTLYATSGTVPYMENALSPTCFAGSSIAYQVDRFRYFIKTFNGVPWLMLDQGLDLDQDGVDPWTTVDDDDMLPLAPYVEDMQVAYVMNRSSNGTAPDTDSDWVVGDDKATTTPEAPDPSATAPVYSTGTTDALRSNLSPANIQEVRVSLDVRSAKPDRRTLAVKNATGTMELSQGDDLPQMENEQVTYTTAQKGNYHRRKLTTTIAVRNMNSKGMFNY